MAGSGSLANITDPIRRTLSHKNVAITDSSITEVIPAVGGARIKVRGFMVGTNTSTKLSLRSGNTNDIIDLHLTQINTYHEVDDDRAGLFTCNESEALTIQSDDATLDANIYVQYWYDTGEADYS